MWVLTEAVTGIHPEGGDTCDAGSDWGYRVADPQRRKVLMWSREPWRDVEWLEPDAPAGRLVAATTDTGVGPLRVVGVCIPWRDAHVGSGRRDRRRWEDHLAFLDALGAFLARQPRPLVVAGDFNQRLPRARQPEPVYEALLGALRDCTIATADAEPDLLDHIAHTSELTASCPEIWPGVAPDGRVLSDHGGAGVMLERVRVPPQDRPLR